MNQSDYTGHKVSYMYMYRPRICLPSTFSVGRGVHSKSVRALGLVTRALATIIHQGKLVALVKVSGCALDRYSGDHPPAVYK